MRMIGRSFTPSEPDNEEVETQVGRALIRGDVSEGGVVRIDAHDGELVVNYEKATARHGLAA